MTEKLCQDPSRMGMLEPQSDGEGQDGSSGILITGTETIIQVFYPEIIRLKDREKELCFYDDTPATKRMRDNLNRFNVFASKHSIDLCVSDGEFRSVLDRKSPEESEERRYGWGSDQNERFIDLSRNRLHRVFNCSFD